MNDPRVARIRPDVPAIDREFDYLVPEDLAGVVRVGTIVRALLHGRRVRGWVTALDVASDAPPERLRPITKVAGDGPPPEIVDLAGWVAWRWCGPVVHVLRSASPPNAVAPAGPALSAGVTPGGGHRVELVVWPPATDRRALVDARISGRGSTIVVVPDGARLGALLRHLAREGRRVHVLRSDTPDAQRTRAWAEARSGDCVVVGGRSAVWAPVPDLASIVVLDESDEALQEERVPTWHARDVAIERARRAGAPVTLVSPAPTLEGLAAAGWEATWPDPDAARAGWPIVEVVDRREQPPGLGLLTEPLARALHRAVDGGRAVCVVNRKGRARLLVCDTCRAAVRCQACGAAVAEHPDDLGVLRCPRCEQQRPRICVHCHGTRLRVARVGVTRLRDDLAALMPRATVLEVDASTETVGDAAVLVGTEAVLHRVPPGPPVRLVAFLDFDQELLAPRVRVGEQALTLLARAARLVGPRAGGARLLLQTRTPDHPVVVAARRADPRVAIEAERVVREALGHPPFGAVAEISGAIEPVAATLDILGAAPGVTVLGPVEQGPATRRALVRAPDAEVLADVLGPAAAAGRAAGRVRIAVGPPRV